MPLEHAYEPKHTGDNRSLPKIPGAYATPSQTCPALATVLQDNMEDS